MKYKLKTCSTHCLLIRISVKVLQIFFVDSENLLTFARSISNKMVTLFTGTFVANGQVDTLLVTTSANLEAFTALIEATKALRFVGPISAVVFAVANAFQGNAHFAISTAIKLCLRIAANLRIT